MCIRDRFRGECLFSTWLFRITANSARDYIRHKNRHQTVSLTSSEEDDDDNKEWDVPVTSGDTVPESSLEKKELILGVRRAIEQLPEDQRAVVVMRDIHELPYKTIADTLGIELGTVKSRLNLSLIHIFCGTEKAKYVGSYSAMIFTISSGVLRSL